MCFFHRINIYFTALFTVSPALLRVGREAYYAVLRNTVEIMARATNSSKSTMRRGLLTPFVKVLHHSLYMLREHDWQWPSAVVDIVVQLATYGPFSSSHIRGSNAFHLYLCDHYQINVKLPSGESLESYGSPLV